MTAPARELPDATELTDGQYRGWNCVWCDQRLTRGAVLAGRATGYRGVHDMSTDVYACPDDCTPAAEGAS